MTVFKKTILGRFLGGVGKVIKAVAPVAVLAIPGGAVVTGALTTGKIVKAGGLLSKIGGIFKKKEGGTVLGNFLRGTTKKAASAAVESVGVSVGSTVHQVAENLAAKTEGSASNFGEGFKEGFLGEIWKNNKGIVIAVGAGIMVLIGWLIFRKKRR